MRQWLILKPYDEPTAPIPPDANFYDDANEVSMELPLETKTKRTNLITPIKFETCSRTSIKKTNSSK
jgi:hypothetical protein